MKWSNIFVDGTRERLLFAKVYALAAPVLLILGAMALAWLGVRQ